jgi:hypothetical protein
MTATLLAANCLWLFTANSWPLERWVQRNFANVSNPNLVMGLLLAGAVGWGPVSLVLSGIALRQLRHDPALRGEWIARIAVVAGILGTAGFVLFLVVAFGYPWFRLPGGR